MLRFSIYVIFRFEFVASIAFVSPLKVVILTRGTYPPSVRKLKLLIRFWLSLALFWVLSKRLLFFLVSHTFREWGSLPIAWNEMIRSWLVDLMIFFIGIHEFVQILRNDALKLRIIKACIQIVFRLLRCEALSFRFFLSLMFYQRSATVVMSERTHEILRFDGLFKRSIKVTPIIWRPLSVDWSWIF